MGKIVVFGGAFNPPLNSHFLLAEQIVNELEDVQKVIFVPVNSKYQKKENVINNEHRYNMLKLICDDNEKFEVSRIELDSERQLYTLETLNKLKEKYKNDEIVFATGTDNLMELETWHNPQELLNNFKILVLERDKDILEQIVNSNDFLLKNKNAFLKLENNIRTNLSSTLARDKIRRKKSIRYMTPDIVYEYIKENHLYED